MTKSITHIMLSLLMLVVTTGFTTSGQCCQHLSAVDMINIHKNCCEGEACNCSYNDFTRFQLKDRFIPSNSRVHIDISGLYIDLFSGFLFIDDHNKKEKNGSGIFSNHTHLFNIHTILARWQCYLL